MAKAVGDQRAKAPTLWAEALRCTTTPSQSGLSLTGHNLPRPIANAGVKARRRFLEFFAAQIRNRNTREAYINDIRHFFEWLEGRGCRHLDHIEPLVVAAYVEDSGKRFAKPTVKRRLSAIRRLFDWLVIGQILPSNPASCVRGPSHVVDRGTTPVLSPEEARALLESIDTTSVIGLRDRAIIGVMVYSFARVSAVAGMAVNDYYPEGKKWWIRLREKGGKLHHLPAHHVVEDYLDAYLQVAGIATARKTPLFRSADTEGALTSRGMTRNDMFRMVKRRARAAGISPEICCHSFRATGITEFLKNGGHIETAQKIAGHSSPRTTKLYDRSDDDITLEEIERIRI